MGRGSRRNRRDRRRTELDDPLHKIPTTESDTPTEPPPVALLLHSTTPDFVAARRVLRVTLLIAIFPGAVAFRLLGSPGRLFSGILLALGFIEVYYGWRPTVVAPSVDAKNPFARSFSIENGSYLPLSNVWPDCKLEWLDLGWMASGNGESVGFETWANLAPGEKRPYKCPLSVIEKYKSLFIVIDVSYERWIAWWPIRDSRRFRFQVERGSDEAGWIEGYDFSGDLGHPAVPPIERSKNFYKWRRKPGDRPLGPDTSTGPVNRPTGFFFGRLPSEIPPEDRP